MTSTLERDLENVLERSREDLGVLRGGRVLVTGGTGYVGTWLLSSLLHANARLDLGIRAVVPTRSPEAFLARAPRLAADAAVALVRGDVREGRTFAGLGAFDAVVHAATSADAKANAARPGDLLGTIVDGTRHALAAAETSGAIPFLLTSSGAVYGRQPTDLASVDETFTGGPDVLDARFAYHEGKRLAEMLCALASQASGPRTTVARLFAFVGPFLPLDRHFAIGNFVRDALAGGPIRVGGDGTPVRTYLYGGDMTSWLWRILVRGEVARAYNVGAERPVTIAEAAAVVARAVPSVAVTIAGTPRPGAPAERYVPATTRARTELGLDEWTTFEDAVARTLAHHRSA